TIASFPFSRSDIAVSLSLRTPRKRRSGIQIHNHYAALDSGFALRAPRNDRNLMIVARDAVLGDALIFHGGLQHHAIRQLVDHGALDFLPWRLACGITEAAAPLQCLAAPGQLRFRGQYIGGPFAQVDANAVVGLQESEDAIRRRLR